MCGNQPTALCHIDQLATCSMGCSSSPCPGSVYMYLHTHTHVRTQPSGTREGTPSRHESDNLSVDSGDILSTTPPGSPATQRKRRYPALALSPAQRAQQDPGPSRSHTHMGEAAEGSFFSEKLHRTLAERCHINGL